MIGRSIQKGSSLTRQALIRTKIEYDNGNAYNKRWHWKWPQAFIGSSALHDPTRVKTPEEGEVVPQMWHTWVLDWTRRILPGRNN